MKNFNEGDSVYVIEQDGISLGHYVDSARENGKHKVKVSTGTKAFIILDGDVMFPSYSEAKPKFLDAEFMNSLFSDDD